MALQPTIMCNSFENKDCTCPDEYDSKAFIPESKSNLGGNSRQAEDTIFVNFGEICVSKEKTIRVPIINTETKSKYYAVHRNQMTLPMYQTFRANLNSFKLLPNESIDLKITYKPLIPMTNNVDFFRIVDLNDRETRIIVDGKAIGPNVQISTNFIKFNTWPEQQTRILAIEIRNMSDFPVQYVFDIDEQPQPVFKISPSTGIIDGKRHQIVNITFCALQFGEYSQRLFCMIHHHPPLIVDCFGVYWRNLNERSGKRFTRYPETLDHNYLRYMRDVQTIMPEKPAFSFIDCYLNFGNIDFRTDKMMNRVTSFTNHRDHPILVKWYPDDCFKVTPKSIQIPANESVLFECNFHPHLADNIYSRNLLFNIFGPRNDLKDETYLTPMPATLRVLGQTFSENNLWIPQFEVNPGTVILPPVLPGDVCFTTMELKSFGYLPTSFKFISPTASNFLVKPMMGLVRGVAIIVVQMQSIKIAKPKVYVEQWMLMLNNDKNHRISICLKGYAEYPSISIGSNNTITLKGVQVGCQETVDVPIMNPCQHQIFYEFLDYELTDGVRISEQKRSLAPNETGLMNVSFRSRERICKQLQVTCLVYAINKLYEIYGSPVEVPCLPAVHDFGMIECSMSHQTEFLLFNYGPTTIHYALSMHKDKAKREFLDVSLTPVYGTVEAKSHSSCILAFKPEKCDSITGVVYYALRPSAFDKTPMNDTWKAIFTFKANTIYPYFQVIEIADHNFGPLFSKHSLWRCLNINWLNYALSAAKAGETSTAIDLCLPDAEMTNSDFFLALAVQNVTPFPVHVALKRRKLCDCELKEDNRFLSIRKRVYDCPHRQMCKISTMKTTILPQKIHVLKIELSYNYVGHTTLSYILNLGSSRNIILNFHLHVIGVDQAWLSKYHSSYSLILLPVCLADKQPNVQVFWFYNNTSTPSTYRLDESEFGAINTACGFEVFKCVNPYGIVYEGEAKPLLIEFHPLENKLIQLDLPLYIGTSEILFNLRALARRSSVRPRINEDELKYNTVKKAPIHLSMERMRIKPFPVWSNISRLIFMTNMSQDILSYSWQTVQIDDICSVEVLSPDGILYPEQKILVVIKITSFGNACMTHVHLPCKLYNHTKQLQYEKSMEDYEQRQLEIKDEFIITEDGTFYPPNEIEIHPKPQEFYVTVALNLRITSFIDRDIYHSTRKQLVLSPRNILPLCITNIPFMKSHKNELCKPIIPIETSSSSSSYNDDLFEDVRLELDLNTKHDNIPFFRDVIEALLADAVFSKMFQLAMHIQKHAPPRYYTQIKPQPGEDSDVSIQNYFKNICRELQMPFLKEVIHDLILKGFMGHLNSISSMQCEEEYSNDLSQFEVCQCSKNTNAQIGRARDQDNCSVS